MKKIAISFALIAALVSSYLVGVVVSKRTGAEAYKIILNRMSSINESYSYEQFKDISILLDENNPQKALCVASGEAVRIFDHLKECATDSDCGPELLRSNQWSNPEIQSGVLPQKLEAIYESCKPSKR